MRETSFIEQNKAKWQEFEQVLEGQHKDPNKLSDLFIQITDDLSYSRTFYPNRSVRVYLNGLAQRIFFSIYKNRRSKIGRLVSFWTDELPQLIYEARREFLFAFLLFVGAFLVGALSMAYDPEFANVILGEEYVRETMNNIDAGDPMRIYKDKGQFGMFLGITVNNMYVAFLTFVMGVFYGIGSIVILVQNGIMVGTFQYFFIEKGLFWESFLTIWIHGTLEISAIIIAGAAGLTMGKGLAFPGTYTRLQSFQRSARRGVKIMIGIVPVIILAGFFEGFLTRYTETPNLIRGLFILICLLFVLVYYIWYPKIKARVGFDTSIRETKIPPDGEQQLKFNVIKSSGDIFSEIFIFYRKYIGRIALLVLGVALAYTTLVFLLSPVDATELFFFSVEPFSTIGVLDQFFVSDDLPFLWIINTLLWSIVAFGVFRLVKIEAGGTKQSFKKALVIFSKVTIGMLLVQSLFLIQHASTFLPILFLMPALLLWLFVLFIEAGNPVAGFGQTLRLLRKTYGRTLGVYLMLFFLGLLFFSISDSVLLWFYLNLVTWVVHFDQSMMDQLSMILQTFISIYMLFLMGTMLFIGFGLHYFSVKEIAEANNLKDRIQSIGQGRSIRGMEKE